MIKDTIQSVNTIFHFKKFYDSWEIIVCFATCCEPYNLHPTCQTMSEPDCLQFVALYILKNTIHNCKSEYKNAAGYHDLFVFISVIIGVVSLFKKGVFFKSQHVKFFYIP